MNYIELKKCWLADEEKSFQGWDFSYLKDRWEDESLPWDYREILEEYIKPDMQLLDMGTGGGEFLLTLNHPYSKTAVTEAWEPNVKLCREKLQPLGICVKQVFEDDMLPFEDNTFDIVINRHESYRPEEVKRILKPDGIFITQQIGGKNNESLSKKLIPNFKSSFPNQNLEYAVNAFDEIGFDIIAKNTCFPYLRFFDVGAVVYFAKIIEWEFPNFKVEDAFDRLCDLQIELETNTYIESLEHRYMMVVKNNK